MAEFIRVNDEQAAYLKALMRHIEGLLDNDREAVLSVTADTSLACGATTSFLIEVECIGNQVMRGESDA